MSYRAGYEHCWPPQLTWEQPAAFDARGAWCTATEDWLCARWGAPEHAGAELAPETITDAELDVLLGELGFERVRDA